MNWTRFFGEDGRWSCAAGLLMRTSSLSLSLFFMEKIWIMIGYGFKLLMSVQIV
jgi:hypothetical protein